MTDETNTGLAGDAIGLPEETQMPLFEGLATQPRLPHKQTLAWECLSILISGKSLTHPEFEALTGSWRLAAVIEELRRYGWAVITINIQRTRKRPIACYKLPQWLIKHFRGMMP